VRIRKLAVTTGAAVVLAVASVAPVSAALAAEGPGPGEPSVAVSATDEPTAEPGAGPADGVDEGADEPAEGGTPASKVFGTVTSFDAATGVLVVATGAGGSVTGTVTERTAVRLASDLAGLGDERGLRLGQGRAKPGPGPKAKAGLKAKAEAKAEAEAKAKAKSKGKGKAKAGSTATPAERRAAALAALVAGADLRLVALDARTGDLRVVVVAG
jgi:hypothetical protein